MLTEILGDLALGEFEVKLNHRRLLDAMLELAGVPPQKFRTICSAIDKLDKEAWEVVRAGGWGGRAQEVASAHVGDPGCSAARANAGCTLPPHTHTCTPAEMVEEKGLPGAVADRIGKFVVLRGPPMELLATLSAPGERGQRVCVEGGGYAARSEVGRLLSPFVFPCPALMACSCCVLPSSCC